MANKHTRRVRRLKHQIQNSQAYGKIKHFFKRKSVQGAIALILVIALFTSIYAFNKYKTYKSFNVLQSEKIGNGANCKYLPYKDFVIKYSGDGISYINEEGTVWNEAFEMKNPMVDVCQSYVAVADKNTNDIYIYNEDGKVGKVTTSYPIVRIEIAKQGVVTALLENKTTNYIEVYSKDGKRLVSHKTLIDENGYPLNFSMSEDGTKLIVSYLTVQKGLLNNKVMFYNFSDAGKNYSDKMVKAFDQYKESIVPTVKFVSNNDAIAIGEDVVSIYKMNDQPTLKKEIKIKDEIQKVFYNEEYIGLVFKNRNKKQPYRIEIYNLSGSRVMKTDIGMYFDKVSFSDNNVLMYNDMNCQIISLKGVTKFEYTFKKEITGIFPFGGSNTYLLMDNKAIKKIRLK